MSLSRLVMNIQSSEYQQPNLKKKGFEAEAGVGEPPEATDY